MAREKGFSNEKIIRIITSGRFYAEQKEVAKKFHKHLGISYGEFMRITRQR
jgi:hypothetical protein